WRLKPPRRTSIASIGSASVTVCRRTRWRASSAIAPTPPAAGPRMGPPRRSIPPPTSVDPAGTMPLLKLQRFRVKQPRPEALARYLRVYASEDLYHRAEQLPPLSGEALFDRDAPITLELGSGRGEFMVEQARQQPDRLFVGLEI